MASRSSEAKASDRLSAMLRLLQHRKVVGGGANILKPVFNKSRHEGDGDAEDRTTVGKGQHSPHTGF